MADAEEVRIELGFSGGGAVHVTCDQAQFEQLQTALDKGDGGWVTITAKDDQRYQIAVDKLIFVRTQVINRSIGFAS